MSMRDVFWIIALSTVIGLLSHQRATGQCRVNEAAKLTASDAGGPFGSFGSSVSASGNVVVVGAAGDDHAGILTGSAYLYRFDESAWVEVQKITASDGAALDRFGSCVSISGDVTVVGAWGDEDAGFDSGSAYVYRFDGSTWVEEQKLTASDGAAGAHFGGSVSISVDTIMVGAPMDDVCARDPDCDSGSTYVYRFDGSTWVEVQKLTASDAMPHDHFGRSVSVSEDVVVVGSTGDDHAGDNSGSAYVYRFDGDKWNEEQKLTASDAIPHATFGFSVSVIGSLAVIGAFTDDEAGVNSGSVYVYRFDGSTWVEEQKLTASDGAEADGFGASVSVRGDVALIAAAIDHPGSQPGSAYVFRFDGSTWVEEQQLTAANTPGGSFSSGSVSLSGDVAVVGAYVGDAGIISGFAYVFGINPIPSDPPCGAIDARQPSAPDGSDPAGWDSIAITFDDPPGEMNPEDFAVIISPPGDAPTVTDVTVDGNTATVHFDDVIPTEAWTTITHWPTGAVTRIGYLPADVNNDKYSFDNDVLQLIYVLNGIADPATPAYQTDTDRSGATNANDVLRVIDLLNGAGVFEEWLGATLPN